AVGAGSFPRGRRRPRSRGTDARGHAAPPLPVDGPRPDRGGPDGAHQPSPGGACPRGDDGRGPSLLVVRARTRVLSTHTVHLGGYPFRPGHPRPPYRTAIRGPARSWLPRRGPRPRPPTGG